MGGAAFATGRAVANTWRPLWQVLIYCLLLALTSRFLIYALFEGELLSASGLVTDVLWLTAVGLVGYRLTQVRKMTTQYPWLYERRDPWRYRRRPGS
ncbi:MAG: hypothetical protein JSW09_09820 [Pseudomonadota bacterium]|nr:MAG: hypothetical protein JSW09_09820 [Pseudomonadota bacterium]